MHGRPAELARGMALLVAIGVLASSQTALAGNREQARKVRSALRAKRWAADPMKAKQRGLVKEVLDQFSRRRGLTRKDTRILLLLGSDAAEALFFLEAGVPPENIVGLDRDPLSAARAAKNLAAAGHPGVRVLPLSVRQFVEREPVDFDLVSLDYSGPLTAEDSQVLRLLRNAQRADEWVLHLAHLRKRDRQALQEYRLMTMFGNLYRLQSASPEKVQNVADDVVESLADDSVAREQSASGLTESARFRLRPSFHAPNQRQLSVALGKIVRNWKHPAMGELLRVVGLLPGGSPESRWRRLGEWLQARKESRDLEVFSLLKMATSYLLSRTVSNHWDTERSDAFVQMARELGLAGTSIAVEKAQALGTGFGADVTGYLSLGLDEPNLYTPGFGIRQAAPYAYTSTSAAPMIGSVMVVRRITAEYVQCLRDFAALFYRSRKIRVPEYRVVASAASHLVKADPGFLHTTYSRFRDFGSSALPRLTREVAIELLQQGTTIRVYSRPITSRRRWPQVCQRLRPT